MRYCLRKKGTSIPTVDILIGTITVEKNLILASDDSHFDYFQGVEPRLKIIHPEEYLKNIQ